MRRLIWILWALFFAKISFYSSFLPMWEGPDEYSHFGVLENLVTKGSLPVMGKAYNSRDVAESLRDVPVPWTIRNENSSWLSEEAFWNLPPDRRELRTRALSAIPPCWARVQSPEYGPLYEAQQPPLIYLLFSAPYYAIRNLSLPVRLWILRMLCGMISSFIVPLAFMASARVFRDESLALGAAAIVAAMPGIPLSASRLSNEALGITLGALVVYLLVVVTSEWLKASRLTAFSLGVTLGFGLLTKAYFLTLLAPVGGMYMWLWHKAGHERRQIAVQFSLVLCAVALIAGWWYVRAFADTGTITGEQQSIAAGHSGIGIMNAVLGVQWLRGFDFLVVSNIWLGGWSFLVLRSWMYRAVEIVFLAAGTGLVVRFSNVRSIVSNISAVVVCASCLAAFALGLCYQITSAYRSTGDGTAFGYYAYSVALPEAICMLAGLYSLVPKFLKRIVVPGVITIFAAIEVFGVCFYQMPYYAGLIVHDSRGHVPALHLAQLGGGGFQSLFERLAFNKPGFITSNVLILLWIIFEISIVGTLCVGVVAGKNSRPEGS